jgi:hypothetical protein
MRNLIWICCCALFLTAPLAADDRDEHVRFRPDHVRVIRDYYGGRPSGLPPGLAKQLRRNGRLPPGLEKRIVPFPVEVERRLPPCPPGVFRGMLGGRAILYRGRTMTILDIAAVF